MNDLKQALYLIADEMRGMASMVRYFAKDVYDTERAHRMMELAAKIAALADEEHTPDEVKAIFETEPWLRFSPAVGVDAFVLNEKQELLLIQRRDNNRWAMPGGLSEIGNTFSETAVRELWEEAGMRGEVKRLLGVFDARLWGTTAKVHLINMVFQVTCHDLSPNVGMECLDAGFFSLEQLTRLDLHPGHDRRIPKCFEVLHHGQTYFDPSSSINANMSMHQRPKADIDEK